MKPTRYVPLLISVSLVLFLFGGGLAVRVVAEDNSFHHVVVFSEVLSLVLENYVDPLEAERLLGSAYEGMLGGLDPRGAYLTPEELAEWKSFRPDNLAHPGLSVLSSGRALQVVAVEEGSSAEETGLKPGDQIRSVDGRPVRELSLDQAWRLILGAPGSAMTLEVLQASEGFRRQEIELVRAESTSRAYELSVERGIGILRVFDMGRLPIEELAEELDDVRSRGVHGMLIDLRNVADTDPRRAASAMGLFSGQQELRLKDGEGNVVDSIVGTRQTAAWSGSIATLVNGATAGSAEALATLIQSDLGGQVLGEATYGLGSEAELYEMDGGSALLVSAALWETASGARWNEKGVEPDEVIRGNGSDYDARQADQFRQALEFVERQQASSDSEPKSDSEPA